MGLIGVNFGSRSKVPSIKRFETRQINNVMPVIVESAKELEEKFKDEYNDADLSYYVMNLQKKNM